MTQMGLFKRFTEKHQASKAELESFKSKLKYGTDPKKTYEIARGHYDEYCRLMTETKETLNRVLKSPNCEKTDAWSTLDIQDYGNDCKDSPIGKHIYQRVYGKKHPDYWKATDCLSCGTQLYAARKPKEET